MSMHPLISLFISPFLCSSTRHLDGGMFFTEFGTGFKATMDALFGSDLSQDDD